MLQINVFKKTNNVCNCIKGIREQKKLQKL